MTQEIQQSIENGHKWIDQYADSIRFHVRIIEAKKFEFPKNNQLLGHRQDVDFGEQPWNKTNGWSKPDVAIHGIEIRYLWKQFKPKV